MYATTFPTQQPMKALLAGLLLAALWAVFLTAAPARAAVPEMTDSAVADAVEDELLMDQAVPAYLIDVSAADGIVTLSGTVDNMLARDRAARIAMLVKGVRAVVNKITILPQTLFDDAQIRDNVGDALLLDPATDSYEVDVAVADGTVTLTGRVDSWQEKRLCAIVAKGVNGVTGIDNRIIVSPPVKRPDEEIRFDVEKALTWDVHLDNALIDVAVKDGEVTLTGIVGSTAEKYWALADAYVAGVTAVDNTALKVERWARDKDLKGRKYSHKSDAEIEAAVADALLMDPRVASFNVTAEMADDNGAIILRGTVDNLRAKRAAAQDARNTVGVREVDNRIKVRPDAIYQNGKLESRIRDALARNPYVDAEDITVEVTNGVADLYGTVDTYYEKSQADDTAATMAGIIVVDNNLKVRDSYDTYRYNPYLDNNYIYDYDWYDYSPAYPRKSDAAIRDDIRDQLWWSPFVDSDDVKIKVENGRATLTGTVHSWSEYNAAVANAYDGGAVWVDNDLAIEYP